MVNPQSLSLFGGSAIRTKPFPGWPVHGPQERAALARAVRSGAWGRLQGAEVARFEQRFAALHGCAHAVAVVNGTVSLRLALMAAGLQAGDEVIVPPYTFVATATAVIEANLVPVFADIDAHTFNLDPRAVEAALTPRTRAIIPVHFAGLPADMDALNALAQRHGLFVLEDAAHAHGASRHGRMAGSLGDAGSFSFQSSKNLTCGEGGALTTGSAEFAERVRSLHNCGRVPGDVWYAHHHISGNYRLGELQGALLNAQLDRFEAQTARRDRNGFALAALLGKLPGLHPQQRDAACTRHSYHLFMLRFDAEAFGAPRARVLDALRAEGIPCSGGYGYSLNQQPLFRNRAFGPYDAVARAEIDYAGQVFPVSDRICREAIWLEQRLLLGTRGDIRDIYRAFEKVHAQRAALNAPG